MESVTALLPYNLLHTHAWACAGMAIPCPIAPLRLAPPPLLPRFLPLLGCMWLTRVVVANHDVRELAHVRAQHLKLVLVAALKVVRPTSWSLRGKGGE